MSTRQSLLYIVACVFIVIIGVRGIEYGRLNNFSDQSIQLPVIRSYADPALYSNDLLMSARPYYVTYFYPIVGWLSRFVPLEPLLIGLYFLVTVVSAAAIYFLAETWFPRTGVVALILLMAYFPNPGGDFTQAPFVTHTSAAFTLQMIALVLIFRKRPYYAAAVLGIAANLNPMSTFFVAFSWLIAMFVDRRPQIQQLIFVGLIIFVLALPVLIWKFTLPGTTIPSEVYIEINRIRSPHHLFPSSVSPVLWLTFLLLLIIWRISFNFGKPQDHSTILKMSFGVAILVGIGVIFSEFFPVPSILELSLIRSTWLINVFILLYLSNMIVVLLKRGGWQSIIAYVFVLLFAASRLYIEFVPQPQPVPYPLFIDLDTPFVANHKLLIAALIAVSLMVIAWILSRMMFTTNKPALIRWSLVSIVCLTSPALIDNATPSAQKDTLTQWQDMLIWIRDNTPSDATFFTPPTLDGFRVVTERSQLGDWKDGSLGIFASDFALEWWDRMAASGFDVENRVFRALSHDELCAVTSQYALDYVIIFRDGNIPSDPVYENSVFELIPTSGLNCGTIPIVSS